MLTPVVVARLNSVSSVTSADPRLFIGSALFALITVSLSCRRPGRMASKVSPIEAVRYTEGASPAGKKNARRRTKQVSLLSMAWANLGRSRGKTAVTVLSLSLAAVLLTVTVTLSGSFDMNKYLANFVSSDFLIANAGQFQTNNELFSAKLALPQSAIDAVTAQGGITDGGRIYGKTSAVEEFVTEDTDLSGVNWRSRAAECRDVTYTVAALVSVPTAFSYRYYGDDEFVLDARTFLADSGTDNVMYYAFNTQEDAAEDMETFLKNYTENDAPELDYESKATYTAEFDSVRSMFLLLGGTLSAIVGLVGILNFANAIITGISARRRELAVLRSVGMTARQVHAMLMLEGLLYTLGAVALALVLTLLTAPAMNAVLSSLFWFLTYRFTLWPVLAAFPVFAALGGLIPVLSGRVEANHSIVERLRQE